MYGESDQIGSYAYSAGPGRGIIQYYGPSINETAGMFGDGLTSNTTNGIACGVVGETRNPSSNNNSGVFGYASDATGTTTRNWDVFGLSDDGTSATGGLGIADGSGANGHGIEGDVLSGSNQIGVFGYAAGSAPSYYAGYFIGQLYATSALSGIKAFKIDHPLDPENKYLFHSFFESDEMLNQYTRNVVTNAAGLAAVSLPSYFEALNKDFCYQLTVIGQFTQAIVAEEIAGNRFMIRTDKPNVKVSWMVQGVRRDPLAERFRIRPEVEKPASEKGTYLVPELYGKSMEQSAQRPSYLEKGTSQRKVVDPKDTPKAKK